MEEHFPASILVLAGLLRVAGASRSEPWSSHTTDQSSLEEGVVIATGRLVPIKEEDPTQVTFLFDSFTSDFPNDGVSHLHEIIRTEAVENSNDGGQPLTFPDRPPGRSEPSFSGGALLGHQSKEPSTSRPQISRGMSSGLSKMVAESANQPGALTTFLPRGDRTENATGHDLTIGGKPSSLVPTKAAEVDLQTPSQPEPLGSTGPKRAVDGSPSLATGPENPHTFTLGTNSAKSEVTLDEAKLTPAEERRGDLVMFLPSDNQQPLVDGGQMQPDLRTPETPGAPGLLGEAQLNLSALFQQRSLSEEHVVTQQPDVASSPHRKTTRHKANQPAKSTNQPEALTTFLPRGDRTENATGEDLKIGGKPSSLVPTKVAEVDLQTPSQPGPLGSAGPKMAVNISPSLATRPGNPHKFTLATNSAKSEVVLDEAKLTPAEERRGNLVTFLPSDNQQPLVDGGEMQPDLRTPETPGAPGLLGEAQLNLSALFQQRSLSEEHVVTQQPDFTSSPHGKVMRHEANQLAKSTNQPEALTTFLPRGDRTENATGEDLKIGGKPSSLVPTKVAEVDLLTSLQPEPLGSAGPKMAVNISPSLATRPGNPHKFTLATNSAKSEVVLDEAKLTPAEERRGNLVTFLPSDNQQPLVDGGEMQPDLRTPETPGAPGLLGEAQLNLSALFQQRSLSEEHVVTQQPDFTSSPHGKVMRHEANQLAKSTNQPEALTTFLPRGDRTENATGEDLKIGGKPSSLVPTKVAEVDLLTSLQPEPLGSAGPKMAVNISPSLATRPGNPHKFTLATNSAKSEVVLDEAKLTPAEERRGNLVTFLPSDNQQPLVDGGEMQPDLRTPETPGAPGLLGEAQLNLSALFQQRSLSEEHVVTQQPDFTSSPHGKVMRHEANQLAKSTNQPEALTTFLPRGDRTENATGEDLKIGGKPSSLVPTKVAEVDLLTSLQPEPLGSAGPKMAVNISPSLATRPGNPHKFTLATNSAKSEVVLDEAKLTPAEERRGNLVTFLPSDNQQPLVDGGEMQPDLRTPETPGAPGLLGEAQLNLSALFQQRSLSEEHVVTQQPDFTSSPHGKVMRHEANQLAKSTNQPEALTTFLPRGDRTENATGEDLKIGGKPSSLVPTKVAEVDLLTSLQPEPLGSAGPKMAVNISPSLATRPENPHKFTLGTNSAKSEVTLDEAKLTPAEERRGDLVMFLPSDNQQPLVDGGEMQPDLRTPETPGAPGLLGEAQLNLSALFQQRSLSEEHVVTQQPDFTSSPHGKVMRHEANQLAKSTNQPEALTTFLPRGDRTENATGQDLSVSGKPSSLVPTKVAEVDLLTSLQPEPLGSTGPKMAVNISPSLATRPGNPHKFTLATNSEKSEVVLDEAKLTPAKERRGDLVTFLPSDNQQPLVDGGQMQPDLRTPETPGAPGLLGEAQLNLSALFQQRFLSEEHVATQQPDFASSPHGKTTGHEAVGLRTAETPAVPAPSQSHTRSSSLLLTPETLSSGTPPQSTMPGDAGQRDQPRSVFRSPLPPSGDPGVPDGAEEPLRESPPLTLQQEAQPQTTIQPSHFKLSQITAAQRDLLPVSKVQETTPEVPVPTHEQPQLSTMLATAYGQAQGRGLSTSPLGKTTSLHARPTMPHVAASSHVQSPLPDMPDAAGRVTQGTTSIPLPGTFPPLVPKQLASLSTSAPPLTASASASVPTKLLTPGVPATRQGMITSLPTAPQHESEDLSLNTAASVPARLPTPGSLASASAGPHSPAAADSAHATPKPSGLSTVMYGKPQGRALGTPFQAEHQTPGGSVSTPNRPAVPETTAPSAIETGAAAAGPNVLAATVHDGTEPKLPPGLSSPSYAATQSLPIGAYAKLQSAIPSVRAPGPQVPLLGVTLPTHFESQKPAAPASVTKEPQLFPTPVHVPAKLNTKEARAEGRLPVSTTASASTPTHARAPLIPSAHAQTRHHPSPVSAQLEAKTVARGAQMPSSPASSSVQLRGLLRLQPSSSPAFVQTEQPRAVLTSADAATANPKVVATVHPNPHLPTTLGLPRMHHVTAKEEEGGKGSLPSSPPAHQPGIHSTPLPGVSAAAPSQKAGGRDPSSGTPRSGTPAPQTAHHENVNLPILSFGSMAEHFPGVRTTPVLAGDEARDLMQSSRGFLLHLLNQSDVTVGGNLDSAEASSDLGVPPSLQYLSFLIQGTENMICLQPMQNATPPSGRPNIGGPRVDSFQEMLISSTFLGLSHPGASSLMQTSPSSVLLVKPMFVFLPAGGPQDPGLHPAEEEEEHADRYPFPNTAVLRLVASSYEQLTGSNSTIKQATKADSLSTNRQAVPGSVLSSVPEYSVGSNQMRSTTLEAEPFPDQPREVATTRTKSLESRDQEEGSLSSILEPPKSGENKTISLSVEHHVSATSATMASARQRPKTLPSTGELLSSPLRITSLPSAMEHSASPMPTRASRSGPKSQLMFHVEAGHHPVSMTPVTSSRKNFRGPLSTSLAGNMDLPLEAVENLASLRAVSHRFLITEVFREQPSEIQHVPSTVSDLQTFSAVKDLKESAAVNHSYSEAVPALPRAAETSSYAVNGTLARVPKSPLPSPIPPRASERPRAPPSPTPFLAYSQAHTPLSEKHLKDMNLQVRSRPPASVSSQVSTNSYFATSVMKDHRGNLMLMEKASFTSKERQAGATVNNETGKHVRDPETHSPRGGVHFTPTTLGTAPALLSPTGLRSASVASGGTVGSVGFQTLIHKSPLATFHSPSPSSAHKDTTVSPLSGKASPSEVPLTKLRFSVTAVTDKAVFSSPLTAKEELIQHGGGQKVDVSPPFPTSPNSEGGHQGGARQLKYEQTRDAGSSALSPNTTSSSLRSSVVNKAPAFFETMLSSGVPHDGPVDKVLDQASHLRSLPLDTSETTFPPLPTPSILEGDLQDGARPMKYEQTQDSGSSALNPNSTSSPLRSTVVNKAPAFFVATVSSGVPSDGPVDKVLDQAFHLRSLPLDTSETTFPPLPTPSSLEEDLQDGARPLKYEQTQDTGSSALIPNSTSSSLRSSVVNKAPAFFETTLSSEVPSDGPADKVLDQASHLRSLSLDTSETTFPPLPTPSSLEEDLQDGARPLKYEQTQDTGSSALIPNSTSSSLSSSVVHKGPAFFETSLSSGVPSDGPADKVLNETSHLQSLPLDTSETTFPPLPTPSGLEGNLQDGARPLKYEQRQDSGSSVLNPNITSSSLRSSVVNKAPAFFVTTVSSGVPSDGPGDKFLDQASHLRSLPLDTSETTFPPLPTPSSLEGGHQDGVRSLKYEQTQDSGSSVPSTNSTSSSLGSSVATKAPAFFETTLSSGIPSDGLVDKVLDQASHLRSLPLDTSETTFPPLPIPSSLEGDLQDTARPLKYGQTHDSGSSVLRPNSTSSSLGSSMATKAPAFFETTLSSGIPSDGLVDKVLGQASHLRSLPLDTSETTFPPLPTSSSLEGGHQDGARPLKYEQTQDSGSSAPIPNSTSSSLGSSVATKAPAFFETTLSSGIPSVGLVDKVLDQASHLRSLSLDTSETTFPPLPSLEEDLQDGARPLKYEQTQDTGSSALIPNSTSSSLRSSVVHKAPAFFETTLSSGVPSDGPADKVLNEISHLESLPLDTSETTFPPLPTPSGLEGNLQDGARPLKYEQRQDSGSSALNPNITSSSLRSSVVNKAPAFFVTTVSSGVPSDGPGDKFLNQASHLRSLPLDTSETTFPPLPTPSSLEGGHQDGVRPLKYGQTQDSGSSVPSTNSTSSSLGSSVATKAPAFFETMLSSGIPSDGLVDKVLDQASHLRSLPLDTSETTFPPLPTPSSLEGDLQDTARPLKYEQTHDSGSSVPSTNSTSSSLGSSVATKAPAFFETTLSSGVPSDGPVDKVLDQVFHLRSLPLDTSETTLRIHTQVLLSLESLSDTPEITAKGDFMVEATSAVELEDSDLHTVGEPVTVMMDVTETAGEDSSAVLWQSDSSLLEWKLYHRRPTRSDDVILDGSAVVSDDSCGSGNYTSEMSLRRARGQPPSHPDSFLALIVLQSNRSHPTLRVESCCVTPTARPTGPDAACCLFPRTPPECRYIQPHQNDEPQTASFTIQLFGMLNRSVAYLHCELSICLNNHPGCEQSCSEDRETRFRLRDQSSYQTFHNLISFGPVLKAQPEFPSKVAAGSELAMMFPVLLGSLAGIAVLLGISIFIWFHQRNKIKTAVDLEGLCSP